ncbi:MAG: cation transporter [Lysobacterales bacterium]|nr:MAG: cation transporter [Xanthomonadales bacterium]
MEEDALARWRHDHSFGQDRRRPGETRTQLVIAITATMMVVEIAAGVLFGSMALLADGLHMASHAAALGINAYAYAYARRHARDASYSFGTGKVNTLGGFTGAVLLAAFALLMASESVQRLVVPVPIAFDQAIWVAVLGLVVNGVSLLILGRDHGHAHGADDERHEDEAHDHHDHDHAHEHDHEHAHAAAGHDHNLVAAYLHVLADALTSVLAIVALLAAKYFGLAWMDPFMGLVGAALVARWSFGLLKATSAVLLDRSAAPGVCAAVKEAIERVDGNRVIDLHVWCIGLNLYSAALTVVTPSPRPPEHYKALLPAGLNIVHATVEIHSAPAAR